MKNKEIKEYLNFMRDDVEIKVITETNEEFIIRKIKDIYYVNGEIYIETETIG